MGAASDKVTIGLRPEHLSLAESDEAGSLTGRLVHRENLGADLYLHLSVQDGAHRMVVRTAPHEIGRVSIGDDVRFVRKRGEAMVFGSDGKRVRLSETPAAAVPEVA